MLMTYLVFSHIITVRCLFHLMELALILSESGLLLLVYLCNYFPSITAGSVVFWMAGLTVEFY